MAEVPVAWAIDDKLRIYPFNPFWTLRPFNPFDLLHSVNLLNFDRVLNLVGLPLASMLRIEANSILSDLFISTTQALITWLRTQVLVYAFKSALHRFRFRTRIRQHSRCKTQ